mmetsp:Transcript_129720/g.403426  ORF Transcript_129720/g.403426 Transcript_129720/m.403426 type:complete len:310 (-) Transcript_129720:602-1531(-)
MFAVKSHRMSCRKPGKSSGLVSSQPSFLSSASSFTLFSPMREMPRERTRRLTSSRGRPSGSLRPWELFSSSPISCFLFMKIWRKSSTSFWLKLSSFMRRFMSSSSACSCSVSSARESCTKVQNSMPPSSSSSRSGSASMAASLAIFSFLMSSCCSCWDLGCQPNSVRMLINSRLSIPPLPSLSKRLKTSCSSVMRSSVKPAFLRSRATSSERQESTTLTKPSKSMPVVGNLCVAFGGSCFSPLKALSRLEGFIRPVAGSLKVLKMFVIDLNSASLCSCISLRYSRKSRQLLLFSSTCATNRWTWSMVTL